MVTLQDFVPTDSKVSYQEPPYKTPSTTGAEERFNLHSLNSCSHTMIYIYKRGRFVRIITLLSGRPAILNCLLPI